MTARQILEKANIRVTPARCAVLDILKESKKPLDVSVVLEKIKKYSVAVNRATVFRIVNHFTQEGLTRRVELSDSKYRYELASLPHHHHLVCIKCNSVKAIEECDVAAIIDKIKHKLSFSVHEHRLEFFGLCQHCQNIS